MISWWDMNDALTEPRRPRTQSDFEGRGYVMTNETPIGEREKARIIEVAKAIPDDYVGDVAEMLVQEPEFEK